MVSYEYGHEHSNSACNVSKYSRPTRTPVLASIIANSPSRETVSTIGTKTILTFWSCVPCTIMVYRTANRPQHVVGIQSGRCRASAKNHWVARMVIGCPKPKNLVAFRDDSRVITFPPLLE